MIWAVQIALVSTYRHPTRDSIERMLTAVPVLEEQGWHLVCGLTPTIGRLGAVYHVWRVPSADGLEVHSSQR